MNPDLYISQPVTSRATGRMMIQVSKRVNDANGHFLGILVFAVAPDDLTSLHRTVDLGPKGMIALIGYCGTECCGHALVILRTGPPP